MEISEPLKDLCNKSELLQLHSLYKQAMYGDCHLNRPLTTNIHTVEKWKEWVSLFGMDEEVARKQYTESVHNFLKKYHETEAGRTRE